MRGRLAALGGLICSSAFAGFTIDMSVTLSLDQPSANIGDPISYSSTVANGGPNGDENNAVYTLTLPANASYTGATPSQGSCSEAGGVVTCSLGTINEGASATVTVNASVTAPGALGATATVSLGESDPDTTNNTATAGSGVIVPAPDSDLQAALALDQAAADIGDPISYSFAATNSGPDDAPNVTATLTLPANTAYTGATPDQGTCSEAGGVVTCDLGTVTNGTTVNIPVTANVTGAGNLGATGSVSSPDVTDPNAANNTVTAGAGVVVLGPAGTAVGVPSLDRLAQLILILLVAGIAARQFAVRQ